MWLNKQSGADRVLDCACGIGKHVLNYSYFGGEDFTDLRLAVIDGNEMIFLKTFHFEKDHVSMIMNVLEKVGKNWKCTLNSGRMNYLDRGFFEKTLKKAGFKNINYYGALDGSSFYGDKSKDLVVTARKL